MPKRKSQRKQQNEQIDLTRQELIFLGVCTTLHILTFVIGYSFNSTTELTPEHSGLYTIGIIPGLFVGLAGAYFGLHQHAGALHLRHIVTAFAYLVLGAVSIIFTTGTAADIWTGIADFPPGKTRTYTTDLPITDIFKRQNKSHISWYIRVAYYPAELDIEDSDHRFMLEHPNPETEFCAHVTLQQAGEARRILHAGFRRLPAGTVRLCPHAG